MTFPVPPVHGPVRLLVADLTRREVLQAGYPPNAPIAWDGRDKTGAIVRAGVYIYLLSWDRRVHRGTVTVLR